LRVPTPVEPAFTRIGGKKGRICTRPLELGSGGCLQGKTSAPCPIKANKTLKYLLGSTRSAQAPVTAKIRGRSANQKGAVLRHCVDSEPIDDRTSVTSWCRALPQPEIESWALCERTGRRRLSSERTRKREERRIKQRWGHRNIATSVARSVQQWVALFNIVDDFGLQLRPMTGFALREQQAAPVAGVASHRAADCRQTESVSRR
jgi:hypothetical protein